MSSDVVSGIDNDKTGEVAHSIHKISLATIVGDLARSPEIKMKNIKRTAKGPRENELAVARSIAIGRDAMRALKNPISDVFVTEGPEEPEPNVMKSLVDTHVTGGRRSMISREDVSAKG
jgi:hypothetical protein